LYTTSLKIKVLYKILSPLCLPHLPSESFQVAVERLHGTAYRLAVPNIKRTECLKSWLSNIISGRLVAIDIVAKTLNLGALIEQSTSIIPNQRSPD
jgi:hypothetical protein